MNESCREELVLLRGTFRMVRIAILKPMCENLGIQLALNGGKFWETDLKGVHCGIFLVCIYSSTLIGQGSSGTGGRICNTYPKMYIETKPE